MLKTISPYYHRHAKIIQGKGALSTLMDILIDFSSTTPLYIYPDTPRIEKKMASFHSSLSSSLFIPYKKDAEIDFTTIDSIIAYGGSQEIAACDDIAKKISRKIPIIHIPFGELIGNEYTHFKGSSDVIIYDWDLCIDLKMENIGGIMSVMLFYLFASSLEYPSSFTKANISFILTTAHSIIEAEREEKSFTVTTLLHFIGDVASNAEHSSIAALMEHLVITSLSTLEQSAATLLLPLVKFIKQTKPTLYQMIQDSLGTMGVEDFCRYWISLSPLEELEGILRQVISNMHHLLMSEKDSAILHTFLTSLKGGEV